MNFRSRSVETRNRDSINLSFVRANKNGLVRKRACENIKRVGGKTFCLTLGKTIGLICTERFALEMSNYPLQEKYNDIRAKYLRA